MKKLAFILSVLAFPAVAEETKPPVWVMAVQLKSSSFTVSYSKEDACRSALKLIEPSLKKLGRADCLPVFQQ